MKNMDECATIDALVNRHARWRPESIALTFEGEHITYAELKGRSTAVARALVREGFGAETRIGYLGKNNLDFVLLLLGAAVAGAVVVPLNWRLSPAEIIAIIKDSRAKGLVLSEEFAELRATLASSLPHLTPILECPGNRAGSFREWYMSSQGSTDFQASDSRDVVVQLYTSGTTGLPKGVLLTHDSLIFQRRASERDNVFWDSQVAEDVLLLSLTVSHVGGLQTIMRSLYAGARLVILREFEAAQVIEAMHNYGISRLTSVPSTLQMLVRHPDAQGREFKDLKIIQYGASPIPLALLKESMALFKCEFVQVYGMTETGGTVVTLPPSEHDPRGNRRMASVGKPLPGVELKIANSEGSEVPIGEVGEIVLRTPAITPGYWNLPEETAKAISPDGWLSTGDAAYIDEDGYVYLCDRIKDMIVSGAENVYPAEVENAIYGHPAVADVAVIGIPDERWGEAVKAVVVLHEGHTATPEEIIGHARQRIAAFKAPKSVDFVKALPRNAAGKVQRRLLREPFWEGRERKIN